MSVGILEHSTSMLVCHYFTSVEKVIPLQDVTFGNEVAAFNQTLNSVGKGTYEFRGHGFYF